MPFDTAPTGKLVSKLSTQIDGQLPDFIQSDHPLFSIFLKQYYQFLEAGELRVTVTIDNVIQEVETLSYILDEDGNRIVLDKGAGSAGKFTEGEIITGGTSKAKATILVDDLGNTSTPRLFITSQQKFETGETITGAISGASGIGPKTAMKLLDKHGATWQTVVDAYESKGQTEEDALLNARLSYILRSPKEYNEKEGDPNFNYGGAKLHNLFWSQLQKPKPGNKPSGAIKELINKNTY